MRCVLLIALFVAVASAYHYNTKNRFYKLLNRYQEPRWFDLDEDDVYGYNYVDKYDDDLIDQIRRHDIYGKGRGGWSTWDDQYDIEDLQDKIYRRQWYNDEDQYYMGGSLGQLKEVEDANVKLASRLYKQTKDDKDDKNTVVSPISIQLALAALNQGARGNTKRQINRVIGGRGLHNQQEQREIFKTLVRRFKGNRGGDISTLGLNTKINPVTLIAVNTRTPAQQWFIQLVTGQLDTQVKHFDFHRRPQESRQLINNWVSRKTNLKINHIVPRDAITDNTKLVLVNALELKANWGNQFRRHVTKEAKFYPLETNKVRVVEVLETVGRFKYYEDELVKIVGIPTTQKELTFYVIVPKHKDGLTAVEKLHLQDGVQFKQLLDRTDLHLRQVGVQVPKFQIKHKIDVRRTLRKQGVTDAFDPLRADFSGITGVNKDTIDNIEDNFLNVDRLGLGLNDVYENEYDTFGDNFGLGDKKLHLNKFIHQSTIKITENGITAGTGSESLYDEVQNWDRTVDKFGLFHGLDLDEADKFDRINGLFGGEFLGEKFVKANRAFAFAVKHNPTNQLVLVGRVIDAAQKKVNDIYQTINNVDQL